jgi:hypothetical protein
MPQLPCILWVGTVLPDGAGGCSDHAAGQQRVAVGLKRDGEPAKPVSPLTTQMGPDPDLIGHRRIWTNLRHIAQSPGCRQRFVAPGAANGVVASVRLGPTAVCGHTGCSQELRMQGGMPCSQPTPSQPLRRVN